MDNEKIGKFIATARKKKNLTQSELASLIHVTDKTVSRWETGRGMPELSLLIPLSNALDISLNELLNGEYLGNTKIKEASEKAILSTINYSSLKLKHNRVVVKIIGVLLIGMILISDMINTKIFCLGFLGLIIYFIWQIIKKKDKKYILITIILGLFFSYAFLTYRGNVRLALFLMGYPKEAYITDFREYKRSDGRYFYPIDDMNVPSGRMGLIKCEEVLGLKFCSYYGYG